MSGASSLPGPAVRARKRAATSRQAEPRAEPVHQPSLERHEPGLEENGDREGDLDRGLLRAQVLLEGGHEQRPPVLEIRHRDHAEDAEEENEPAVFQEAEMLPGWLGL